MKAACREIGYKYMISRKTPLQPNSHIAEPIGCISEIVMGASEPLGTHKNASTAAGEAVVSST
jgi:hypothetical protein